MSARPAHRPAASRTAAPRLLIVSEHFAPSSATSGRRPSRLARFLVELGAPPVVVTGSAGFYTYGVDPGPCIRDELEVHEVPCSRTYRTLGKLSWVGRQAAKAALVLAYRRAIERALRSGPRPDFMLFRGVPFWYFPLARHFSRRWGVPYVLDFGDVWYMRGIRYRRGQRAGARHLVDSAAEAWSVNGADLVMLTTDAQTRIYQERYPLKRSDIMTVRWGYDADELARVEPAPKPPGVFRIVILGRFSVYGSGDAVALAQAVAACRGCRSIEVIHMGLREPALEAAFERASVAGSLRRLGMLPYGECLEMVASADCGVASALSDVSVPVKVYDYIGANLPVLAFAPPGSAMARLLRPFPGATVVQEAEQAISALRRMVAGEVTELKRGPDPTEYSQQYQFGLLVDRLEAILRRKGDAAS